MKRRGSLAPRYSMKLSGQLHTTAVLRQEPIKQEGGWTSELARRIWRNEQFVGPIPGIELQFLNCSRRSLISNSNCAVHLNKNFLFYFLIRYSSFSL